MMDSRVVKETLSNYNRIVSSAFRFSRKRISRGDRGYPTGFELDGEELVVTMTVEYEGIEDHTYDIRMPLSEIEEGS